MVEGKYVLSSFRQSLLKQFMGGNLFKNLVLDEETKDEFFSFDI